MNEVGLLKKQRETLGMTQKQLADALGLCSNHIALIERGERRITKQTLLAVECLIRKNVDEEEET